MQLNNAIQKKKTSRSLWTFFVKPVCNHVCDLLFDTLGVIAKNKAQCAVDTGLILAACQIAGGGPEDPISDICSASMGVYFTAACLAVVRANEQFGAEKCKQDICGSGRAAMNDLRMTYGTFGSGNQIKLFLPT